MIATASCGANAKRERPIVARATCDGGTRQIRRCMLARIGDLSSACCVHHVLEHGFVIKLPMACQSRNDPSFKCYAPGVSKVLLSDTAIPTEMGLYMEHFSNLLSPLSIRDRAVNTYSAQHFSYSASARWGASSPSAMYTGRLSPCFVRRGDRDLAITEQALMRQL